MGIQGPSSHPTHTVAGVLIAGWSSKGGSGTTVVCAGLAVLLSSGAAECTIADLAGLTGDLPLVLGLGTPGRVGAAPITVRPGLEVLPQDCDVLRNDEPGAVVERLTARAATRSVVADCGLITAGESGPGLEVAAAADVSLLVLRPCYLALRRAVDAPIRPSGVVLVTETGRTIGREDVEDVLGVPVRAVVRWSKDVARSVDAGLLVHALPNELQRSLRRAA